MDTSATSSDIPLFSFGIIADVQYADADDGHNFKKTVVRYYRGALEKLQQAITAWNTDMTRRPSFVLQLGDAIDGLNSRRGASHTALRTMLDAFCPFAGPVYHVLGNHEYYNFSRQTLLKSQLYSGHSKDCTSVEGKVYYSIQPHPQLKVLVLDCYEVSMIASPPNSQEYQTAVQYMQANTNSDKNSSDGLEGELGRFVKFNGAVSEQQLMWLENNLKAACDRRQNVIVIGHCSVYSPSSYYQCTSWNGPEILAVLQHHSDIVLGYLAGHNHDGGLAVDPAGILHLTLPGVVENSVGSDFCTAYMYHNRLVLQGHGRVPSLSLPLRFPIS